MARPGDEHTKGKSKAYQKDSAVTKHIRNANRASPSVPVRSTVRISREEREREQRRKEKRTRKKERRRMRRQKEKREKEERESAASTFMQAKAHRIPTASPVTSAVSAAAQSPVVTVQSTPTPALLHRCTCGHAQDIAAPAATSGGHEISTAFGKLNNSINGLVNAFSPRVTVLQEMNENLITVSQASATTSTPSKVDTRRVAEQNPKKQVGRPRLTDEEKRKRELARLRAKMDSIYQADNNDAYDLVDLRALPFDRYNSQSSYGASNGTATTWDTSDDKFDYTMSFAEDCGWG